jgi:hypothetical protein
MSVLEYRSGSDEKADRARGLTRHWLGWAIYLGMSWTWCIGMFLPVLLIRDYGAWAWVVFAVPNVLGAAAMGWVLREGQSEGMVAAHRGAMESFSSVTAIFQIFFALWMSQAYRLSLAAPLLAVALLLMLGDSQWRAIVAAIVTLVISLVCISAVSSHWLIASPVQTRPELLSGLSVVCVLGFSLCPYLDDTFHRARQALPSGRLSFSLGFGVFFLLMILFTLLYAPTVIGWTNPARAMRVVVVHWTVQLALTTALHWQTSTWRWTHAVLTIALAALIWFCTKYFLAYRGDPGEIVYRLFMSFYGLIFPAYVWICMTPSWREPVAATRGQLSVFAIACVVAAPFYWVAFIEGKMGWVVPGVLVVLAARFAVPKARLVA